MKSRYQPASVSSASSTSSRSAPRSARFARCSTSRGFSPSSAASSTVARALCPRRRASSSIRRAAAAGSNDSSRYTARASSITAARCSAASVVEQPLGPVEPSGRDPRPDLQPLALEAAGCQVGLDRPLGETPERNRLAARPDRLRKRPELVRDEHDDGVVRRLLEILEERVRSVLVHQVRAENQVHAAVGLERPHVEVAAQLADRVDPDLVAERLEDVEVGVGAPERRGRSRRGVQPRTRVPLAACRSRRGP